MKCSQAAGTTPAIFDVELLTACLPGTGLLPAGLLLPLDGSTPVAAAWPTATTVPTPEPLPLWISSHSSTGTPTPNVSGDGPEQQDGDSSAGSVAPLQTDTADQGPPSFADAYHGPPTPLPTPEELFEVTEGEQHGSSLCHRPAPKQEQVEIFATKGISSNRSRPARCLMHFLCGAL